MASAATLIQPKGELWEKIRVELNEDLNTREQYLENIKEWLRKQPHLPDEWEDACLMTFLRGCNFSLEKCKKKLDMYFTMRNACPEFFANRDVTRPELQDLMIRTQGPTLPGLTPNGRRVTICKDTSHEDVWNVKMAVSERSISGATPDSALDKNLNPNHLNDSFKLIMMVGDVRLKEELVGVAGDIYILDASVVAPSHLGKISPATVKKFLICIQEAYPIKLKEVHVVNASPVVDAVFTLVKPFLKDKIKNRVHFHSDFPSLHKFVPKDMLPTEYGGELQLDVIHNAWMKKLADYRSWFQQQEQLKANEALRPGKPKNYDELFGIEGSFRQLAID